MRRIEDIAAIRDAVIALCKQIGRRVAVVVISDAFRLTRTSRSSMPKWSARWKTNAHARLPLYDRRLCA